MTHGRLPNLFRRLYITWAVFWLKQQQASFRRQEHESRERWAAAPAYWDQCRANVDAIEVEIADLEQELH